jgi:hypothetical protein
VQQQVGAVLADLVGVGAEAACEAQCGAQCADDGLGQEFGGQVRAQYALLLAGAARATARGLRTARVAGYSSSEAATALGMSAPAINSALQRARGALAGAAADSRPERVADETVAMSSGAVVRRYR